MKIKIIELRKNGYSVNDIAKELNCAKSTVSYHINRYVLGGKRDKFIASVDDSTIEHIKKLRIEEKTYPEILKIVDITEDKLIRICRNLDLNRSTGFFKTIELVNEDVIDFYKNVNSIRKTAEFFNVSVWVIRKYINNDIIKQFKKPKKCKKQAVVDFRRRVKIKLVEYLGGSCCLCGYNKSIQALQFHHKNPKEKDFAISGKSYSFEKMKKEVDKCILICSNCHIEIHEKIRMENKPI